MPVSTWVEVDLDHFAANLRAIRDAVAPAELLLVVKADAYGHGAVEMAEAAAAEGVSRFGVATLHEGIQLRQAGCRLPILALSPLLPSELGEAIAHDLEPTVGDLAFAGALASAARTAGRAVRCHVEVDTGMGRIGVREEHAERLLEAIAAEPTLRLGSLYTHFPDADAPEAAFTLEQVDRFRALAARLAASGLAAPRLHAANSAGTLRVEASRFNWVRVGLAAYGHRPPNVPGDVALAPVMSFKSRLVQVRELPAGASVSYGRTWVASRPSRIGVVAVGYGHGYSWLLSNRGAMRVAGRRVPIVGRVTMDLTMVDLTDVAGGQVGDEVQLFGAGDAGQDPPIPLEEVAAGSETLPYEVMCTIGKRVTRIYVRRGRPVKLTSLVGERAEWVEQAADHFRMRAQAVAAARRGA
jgi:alanine racemase